MKSSTSILLIFLCVIQNASAIDIDRSKLESEPLAVLKYIHEHIKTRFQKMREESAHWRLTCDSGFGRNEQYSLTEKFEVWRDNNSIIAQSANRVYVSTASRAFMLLKMPDAASYSIAQITPFYNEKRTGQQISDFQQRAEIGVATEAIDLFKPSTASWYSTLVYSKDTTCTKGTTSNDGTLRFEFIANGNHSKENDRVSSGFIVFDLNKDCLPIESEVLLSSDRPNLGNSVLHSKYAYEKSHDVWICSTYTCSQKWKNDPKSDWHARFSYSDFDKIPLPQERTTLEHYGLVDPIEKPFVWWPYALVAVGLVGIGIYIFLTRRAKAKAA